MSNDPHWMEKAFANSHGQFKAKAKKAGMTTKQFASKPHTGKTARQANLARQGMRANHSRAR